MAGLFADELLVILSREQRAGFVGALDRDLDDPGVVGGLVQLLRRRVQGLVNLGDGARNRRIKVADGFDALDGAERGAGFDLLVAKGDLVTRGQPVVRWNPVEVEAAGKSPICPVVALEAVADSLTGVVESGEVAVGSSLFTWT